MADVKELIFLNFSLPCRLIAQLLHPALVHHTTGTDRSSAWLIIESFFFCSIADQIIKK